MTTTFEHSAAHSAAGYSFQQMYGLLVLLDADDDARLSLETRDDIEQHGRSPTLFQLKHSLHPDDVLSVKSDAVWKTFGIWMPYLSDRELRFQLVTCSSVSAKSALRSLCTPGSARENLRTELHDEATRVSSAIAEANKKTDDKDRPQSLPYRIRGPACRSFLALTAEQQIEFLQRVQVVELDYNLASVVGAVSKKLTLYQVHKRERISGRLTQWWLSRSNEALTDAAKNSIHRREVLARLSEFSRELDQDSLPNDFEFAQPSTPAHDIAQMFVRQIEIIGGGKARITNASLAHWRSRNQREKWLSEDISIAHELENFDNRLEARWRERFDTMCEDASPEENEQKKSGLKLFDLMYQSAHSITTQPRPTWSAPFLSQGSMQQLADKLTIGWHPQYKQILSAPVVMQSSESRKRKPQGAVTSKSNTPRRASK